MRLTSKIALALGLIVTLTACGSGADKKEETPKGEAKTESKDTGDVAKSTDPVHIKIGVVGEYNEVLEEVIKRYEAGTGNTVELVKFADYNQPNEALLAGDIDLNAYQHYKFLKEFNDDKGSDLVSIGDTMLAPITLYSHKVKNLDEIKEGAKIAIPNDPSNGSRALFLLQDAGLIKVDGEAGDIIGLDKITENPKNLEIVEMDASQTARSLDDVDCAVVNDTFALDAGLDKNEGIYVEDPKSESVKQYINLIAARKEDENNEAYKEFIKYYQTDETKADFERITKGAWLPAWDK
ncbi:MetQ/NlpA family ABC transporter substrate-binding protein [Anaerococcus degeneri]|uniref:Lipoprotein n=1 Tax=Anaerococcus degeneri TaxID=361500 RepID=A0ABS7YY58_9FIRM|nr:MetQ/NlpA family ABC transporter substrate-binding protein [Anaerococcus degeneri]MBP2015552.1 D-methionine transport system substrate-binding protein [Anaerococcus degeneri]MCA2095908.1 MetQ/NlpA family ABC transporter substrate-binding protein [Anaerococcus degeneri]